MWVATELTAVCRRSVRLLQGDDTCFEDITLRYMGPWEGTAARDFHRDVCETVVLSHLYINAIFLPRQAWDKHRENSKKATVLCCRRTGRWQT